jgi:hypothetical protein
LILDIGTILASLWQRGFGFARFKNIKGSLVDDRRVV